MAALPLKSCAPRTHCEHQCFANCCPLSLPGRLRSRTIHKAQQPPKQPFCHHWASSRQACQLSERQDGPVSTSCTASEPAQPSRPVLAVPVAAALPLLLTQLPAFAEEAGPSAERSAAPTDIIIQATFTMAILALSILTIGVLYLAITSFLDNRTEDEERKKYEVAQKDRELQAAMGGGAKTPKRKRTAEELTRGGGKGFGR